MSRDFGPSRLRSRVAAGPTARSLRSRTATGYAPTSRLSTSSSASLTCAALAESIRRQRADLDRTVAYSRSIGCQRQRFLIFGDSGPAQCGPLEAQINRMESTLAALENQVQRSGAAVEAQRAALAASYDANCRGAAAQPGARRARDSGAPVRRAPEQDPVIGTEPGDPAGGGAITTLGGGAVNATLCVRKCDGYYFPISGAPAVARSRGSQALCSGLLPQCRGRTVPAAPARQGRRRRGAGRHALYLPAQRVPLSPVLDPSCTCRPAGQSWSEALAEAERLVGDAPQRRRRDGGEGAGALPCAQAPARPAPRRAPKPPSQAPAARRPLPRRPGGATARGAAPPLRASGSSRPPERSAQGSSPCGGTERRVVIRPTARGRTCGWSRRRSGRCGSSPRRAEARFRRSLRRARRRPEPAQRPVPADQRQQRLQLRAVVEAGEREAKRHEQGLALAAGRLLHGVGPGGPVVLRPRLAAGARRPRPAQGSIRLLDRPARSSPATTATSRRGIATAGEIAAHGAARTARRPDAHGREPVRDGHVAADDAGAAR